MQEKNLIPWSMFSYYQAAIQAVFELLEWDYKKNCCKGIIMLGKCRAFLQADEEQGSFTLHSHCLLQIGGFDEIKELIFDQVPLINLVAHDEIIDFVDKFFCSSYEYIQNIHVIHEECKACTTIQEMFDEAEPQIL